MFLIRPICLKSLPNIKSLLSLSEKLTVTPRLCANNSLTALEPCPPCGLIIALAAAFVPGAAVFVITMSAYEYPEPGFVTLISVKAPVAALT